MYVEACSTGKQTPRWRAYSVHLVDTRKLEIHDIVYQGKMHKIWTFYPQGRQQLLGQ